MLIRKLLVLLRQVLLLTVNNCKFTITYIFGIVVAFDIVIRIMLMVVMQLFHRSSLFLKHDELLLYHELPLINMYNNLGYMSFLYSGIVNILSMQQAR